MKRLSALLAAGLLLASTVSAMPVSAQAGGNSGNSGCGQTGGTTTGGSNTNSSGNQSTTNRGNGSALALGGLVNVLVQDVQVLALNNNDVNAQLSQLATNPNVSVVCVTDVLNSNDVHILQDILNNSPILSHDLNQSLNNNNVLDQNSVLNDVLSNSNLTVLGVNFDTGTVYVAPQTTL